MADFNGYGRRGDGYDYDNNFDGGRYDRGGERNFDGGYGNDRFGGRADNNFDRQNRRYSNVPPINNSGRQLPPLSRGGQMDASSQPSRPLPSGLPTQNIGGSNVVIYSPQTFNDVQTLIDFLKRQEPVIIDFAKINSASAQRILDFMSGAVYALSGSMQRISQSIFLLTPTGVSITIPFDQIRGDGKK